MGTSAILELVRFKIKKYSLKFLIEMDMIR